MKFQPLQVLDSVLGWVNFRNAYDRFLISTSDLFLSLTKTNLYKVVYFLKLLYKNAFLCQEKTSDQRKLNYFSYVIWEKKTLSKLFRSTWDYLRALLSPKFLLSSASLSEESVCWICGKCVELHDINKKIHRFFI